MKVDFSLALSPEDQGQLLEWWCAMANATVERLTQRNGGKDGGRSVLWIGCVNVVWNLDFQNFVSHLGALMACLEAAGCWSQRFHVCGQLSIGSIQPWQAIIRQITASVTFLPLLDEPLGWRESQVSYQFRLNIPKFYDVLMQRYGHDRNQKILSMKVLSMNASLRLWPSGHALLICWSTPIELQRWQSKVFSMEWSWMV